MKEKDSFTILDGNSFYEVDLSCVRKKQTEARKNQNKGQQKEQQEGRESPGEKRKGRG